MYINNVLTLFIDNYWNIFVLKIFWNLFKIILKYAEEKVHRLNLDINITNKNQMH